MWAAGMVPGWPSLAGILPASAPSPPAACLRLRQCQNNGAGCWQLIAVRTGNPLNYHPSSSGAAPAPVKHWHDLQSCTAPGRSGCGFWWHSKCEAGWSISWPGTLGCQFLMLQLSREGSGRWLGEPSPAPQRAGHQGCLASAGRPSCAPPRLQNSCTALHRSLEQLAAQAEGAVLNTLTVPEHV